MPLRAYASDEGVRLSLATQLAAFRSNLEESSGISPKTPTTIASLLTSSICHLSIASRHLRTLFIRRCPYLDLPNISVSTSLNTFHFTCIFVTIRYCFFQVL